MPRLTRNGSTWPQNNVSNECLKIRRSIGKSGALDHAQGKSQISDRATPAFGLYIEVNSFCNFFVISFTFCSVLAHGDAQSYISVRYRIGRSTGNGILNETTAAIWHVLHEEFVPAPTLEDYRDIAKDFWNVWQFPNCIGASLWPFADAL
jgi:hypothetical protein